MTTSASDPVATSEPRCPTCQAIRQVGANFCSQCGTSFQAWGGSAPGGPPPPGPLDVPLRKVIRFGAGLAIGFVFVGAVVYSVFALLAAFLIFAG